MYMQASLSYYNILIFSLYFFNLNTNSWVEILKLSGSLFEAV